MKTTRRRLFFPFIAVSALFPCSAVAEDGCEADYVRKALVSKDAGEVRSVIENCRIPERSINPRCGGKGICKPIVFAALAGSVEIVEMLANAGADVDTRGGGTTGDTPLIIAVASDNRELVELLVANGADVNKPNRFGATPFWGACAGGNRDYVGLFLENGAEVDRPGRFPDPLREHKGIVSGITPLMVASFGGNHDVVSLLLQHKADTSLKDSVGRTATDYAKGAKQGAIVELLRGKTGPMQATAIPKQPDHGAEEPVAQALRKSQTLAAGSGASNDLRLERFTGTFVANRYSEWDFSYRDGVTIYRVRFGSKEEARVYTRPEKQEANQVYWSTLDPAPGLMGLDGLVVAARQRVADAGFAPTDYTYLKYRVAGPRAPETSPRETLEVFVEVAGDEKVRRVVFHDREFQRLMAAKILKVRIPEVPGIPRPKIPKARIPKVEIPEIEIPGLTHPGIRVQEDEQVAVLTLRSDVLFDFDKWNIRHDAGEALDQVFGVLAGRYSGFPFEIHGHTDSKGTEAYNLNLSKRRADSVLRWLVAKGLSQDGSGVFSHGELRPVVPNNKADGSDNPEGRQKNRRVEIRIHKHRNGG